MGSLRGQGIIIKKIAAANIPAIKEIEERCGLSPWSREDYLNELEREDSVSVVAVTEEKVRGFLVARLIMTSNEAELYNIGVDKKYRRHGIGSLLLKYFIDACRTENTNNIWLEVRKSDLAATDFYRQHGFQIIAERKNFYTSPSDSAYIMKLAVV